MDLTTRLLTMGAAGSGGAEKTYIEDVFSTWLYTGNGSTQTITNGIDLSGKGGLVWIKYRAGAFGDGHYLYDTERGAGRALQSNHTYAQTAVDSRLTAFTSTGFTLDTAGGGAVNQTSYNYASWNFRKVPGFFDVVTWTGNNVSNRAIPHSLGSIPGCIIVKQTSSSGQNWHVWHRSLNPAWTGGTTAGVTTGGNVTGAIYLNSTAAFNSDAGVFTYVNSTAFGVYYSNLELNSSGSTYVAYLFAHDAQLFGDGGNQSVIKCGSYTGNGSTTGPVVDLGWEPQWVMIKRSSSGLESGAWNMFDTMRGIATGGNDARLFANYSSAESSTNSLSVTPTGFQITDSNVEVNDNTATYIYIAIRRGPMKTPTDATKVFSSTIFPSSGSDVVSGPTPTDLSFLRPSYTSGNAWRSVDRLRGNDTIVYPNYSNAEGSESYYKFDTQSGLRLTSFPVSSSIFYNFRRAPGFCDVVAYSGTGSARTVNHNLGVEPELMIVKCREYAYEWIWYVKSLGNTKYLTTSGTTNGLAGGYGGAGDNSSIWNSTTPTSTVFSLGSSILTNEFYGGVGIRYIAYLFASCPGVSKVGSYTGTGTTLNIDCGFTAGARFVLIKRTDSGADWYLWDTTRGIVSGNDPYLLLNTDTAEVTNTDYIDPLNSGFQISSTAPAAINANGGSFIYLAIA